jgi:hypothetical protein
MEKFWHGMNYKQNSEKFIPLTHLLDGGKNLLLSLLLNLWKVDEIQPRSMSVIFAHIKMKIIPWEIFGTV